MRVLAVVPARYASTRLPGKPLLDIGGKPMIRHVWERVSQARLVDEVLVATDDARIAHAVENFGGTVVLTSPRCASGTDRLVEVAARSPADVYLNIQGDEPLLRPADVDKLVATMLADSTLSVATPCYPISTAKAAQPHLVKVVRDFQGRALYFSRATIPFACDAAAPARYWGHVGMYAYRAEVLRGIGRHAPSPLERMEKLEQLRLLQLGVSIQTVEIEPCAPGVDTLEDLEIVRALLDGDNKAEVAAVKNVNVLLCGIKLVITDVDGVLTDGGLYYGPRGEELKRFNARDGLGIKLLQKAGVQVAVLSGRDCPALRTRLKDLGIDLFRLGGLAKGKACRSILEEAHVSREDALFVGDDLPDLEGFVCCGLGVAVADADVRLRQDADLVLKRRGGQGAFRELADILLNAEKVCLG